MRNLKERRGAPMLCSFFLTLALTGCAAEQEVLQSEPPSFYISMAAARAEVDAKAAASMISGFRRNNGRGSGN